MSRKPTRGRAPGAGSYRYDGRYYNPQNSRQRNYYDYPPQSGDAANYSTSGPNYQRNSESSSKPQSAPHSLPPPPLPQSKGNPQNDKRGKLPTAPKGMGTLTHPDDDPYYSKRQWDEQNPGNYNKRPRYNNNNHDQEDDEEEDVFTRLSSKPINVKPVNTFKYMVKCNVVGHIHERIQQVGEGTYGKVYKGKNVITNELVALKKLRLEAEREGFPITSHREIGLLQSFDHENIVGLYEIMVEKNQVFMVFPYMNHDLSGILQQSNIQINDGEKKNIFSQLLKGIEYLHSKRVIHRDIKGSNILIDNKGILKITDFGLARKMKNINEDLVSPNYTNRVITLWYRPPEILLGSTDYGREVDIWGIGCILMELFTRRAIFQGINEIDQLWKVYDVMGTIKVEDWPDAYKLPWFEILRPNFKTDFKFKEKFGSLLSKECYNLAIGLLQINPKKRMTAADALKHEYFKEEPAIQPLLFLDTVKGEWHEFEAKQKRKQKQKQMQQQQQQ